MLMQGQHSRTWRNISTKSRDETIEQHFIITKYKIIAKYKIITQNEIFEKYEINDKYEIIAKYVIMTTSRRGRLAEYNNARLNRTVI